MKNFQLCWNNKHKVYQQVKWGKLQLKQIIILLLIKKKIIIIVKLKRDVIHVARTTVHFMTVISQTVWQLFRYIWQNDMCNKKTGQMNTVKSILKLEKGFEVQTADNIYCCHCQRRNRSLSGWLHWIILQHEYASFICSVTLSESATLRHHSCVFLPVCCLVLHPLLRLWAVWTTHHT